MASVAQTAGKGKKKRVLREGRIVAADEYDGLQVDAKAELIRQLVPLGLMHVCEMLQDEVTRLAGERYSRTGGQRHLVRHGTNPGSVKLAGQRHAIRVPRVRDREANVEIPLEALEAVRGTGTVDEKLLLRVLRGMSCRDYEACAQAVPAAIGLSASTVSRQFIEGSTQKLRELQERDLSGFDFVTLFLDGKAFADDVMVTALGVTIDGRKIILGFVQAGTENESVVTNFLRELVDRGVRADDGLLVVLDGGKGLRAAVKKVFRKKAAVQRWLASSLLDIEPRLHRIQGYKHLGQLREALQRDLGLLAREEAA
jgi:putative transposase